MACDLEPTCNFLFGYFLCTLLEDMIDADITMHMLKGIHTFRKEINMQISRCSPWDMEVKPFPSLRKKNEGLHQGMPNHCQSLHP